jgi:glycosyltransferase involved in cell wall biosynthesis
VAAVDPLKREAPYFLIGCRLAPYKRVDIVVEAFKAIAHEYKIKDEPAPFKLKVFGDGVDLQRLQKIAGDCAAVEFVGRVSEEEKADLFQNCLAFINPQEEDFGITPVESMAAGRPVLAYKKGGALETVIEGETGLFFAEQTAAAIKAIVEKFYSDLKQGVNIWNPEAIRRHARQFSVANFQRQMLEFIENKKNRSEV